MRLYTIWLTQAASWLPSYTRRPRSAGEGANNEPPQSTIYPRALFPTESEPTPNLPATYPPGLSPQITI